MKIPSKIYMAAFDIGHVVCLCDYFFVCQSAFSDFLACGVKKVKHTVRTQIGTLSESFCTTDTEYQTAQIGFFPCNSLKMNNYFDRQMDRLTTYLPT